MFHDDPMPIPSVANSIVNCWIEAENKLRNLLKKKYWSKGEEFITELFHGELREIVTKAAKDGEFEAAFLEDLQSQFPELKYGSCLGNIAYGIEASTILHPRHIETKTGGDLGILLIRPSVARAFEGKALTIDHEYCRGLLCQAKLKKKTGQKHVGTWGRLTPNQRKILSDRTEYLSLLLYEYTDDENHDLAAFHWQLCRNTEIKEIERWLKAGDFPGKVTSSLIIEGLSKANIGTDKPEIISAYIRPEVNSSMEIRIGWPSSKKPPGYFPTYECVSTQIKIAE